MWIAKLLDGRVIIRLDVQPPPGDVLHGWWNLPTGDGPRAELMLLRNEPGNLFRVVKWRSSDYIKPSSRIVAELRDVLASFTVLPREEGSRLGVVMISEADQVLLRLMAEQRTMVRFATRYGVVEV